MRFLCYAFLSLLLGCASGPKQQPWNEVLVRTDGYRVQIVNNSGLEISRVLVENMEVQMIPGGFLSEGSEPGLPPSQVIFIIIPDKVPDGTQIMLTAIARDRSTHEDVIAIGTREVKDALIPVRWKISREDFGN